MHLLLASLPEEIKPPNEALLTLYGKKIKTFLKKFLCWKRDFNTLTGFPREAHQIMTKELNTANTFREEQQRQRSTPYSNEEPDDIQLKSRRQIAEVGKEIQLKPQAPRITTSGIISKNGKRVGSKVADTNNELRSMCVQM